MIRFLKKNIIIIAMLMISGITLAFAPGKKSDNEKSTPETPVSVMITEDNSLNLVMDSFNTVRFTDVEIPQEEETTEAAVSEEQTAEETETPVEEETQEAVAETAPSYVIPCTDEDYNNFLKIVEAEATGGDVMSKIMVADVIINRVRSSRFPNTITEVIFQGNGEQFQPVADGRFYSVYVTNETVEAVQRALYGEDYSMGALFFASNYSVNAGAWHVSALTRLFEYGGHVYFTF